MVRSLYSIEKLFFTGFSFVILFGQLYSCSNGASTQASSNDTIPKPYAYAYLFTDDWIAPDTSLLTNSETDTLIKYGKDLIENTGHYFGPAGIISKNANGMNCQNCHLKAGRQLWANSYAAVFSNYPKVRPRSGKLENLVMRISDCMERSMNGKTFDSLGTEMKAMISYINWVGKDVPKDSTPEGTSIVQLKYLERAADPEKGKIVFETNCVTCHGKEGKGQLYPDGRFLYPPLWGDRSYNTAAGMYRLSRLAGFVKSNMPYQKSTHASPLLTDEEAWDVAAYINSRPRPVKFFSQDWPDISKKPIDHPYGPFADPFTEEQHKYGPFGPIKNFYKNVKTKTAHK